MTADRVTKIELAKVYMELEESGKLQKSNKLCALDDLFAGEEMLAGLAEDNFFLF